MSDMNFKGFLEFVTARKIYGWLYNETRPDDECSVDLYIDGRFHGTYPCNEYHPSLADASSRHGYVLFSIPTPETLLTDRDVTVDVRIHGTATSLPGSPFRTGLCRLAIDTALSGMTPAKANLCRKALTELRNASRRPSQWPDGALPEAILRPSRWFDCGERPVTEYLAHQLHRLNAQNDFHLDGDLAEFLVAHGENFGIGDHALVPVGEADLLWLAQGHEDRDGTFATRLFAAYVRTRPGEWQEQPEAARLFQFFQWALGQVRLPASVLPDRHVEVLNAQTGFGAPGLPLPELYVEAYRQDEALRSCCDPGNDRDAFLIALAVTLWLFRWNLDDRFVPSEIRRVLTAPIRFEGRDMPGLAYFYHRLGVPGAAALTLDGLSGRGRIPAVPRLTGLGVNLFGYMASRTALGQNMRASLAALETAGVPVTIPQSGRGNWSGVEPLHPVNLLHYGLIGAPTDMLNHDIGRFTGAYNIGLLVWEASLPPRAAHLTLELVDEIWTPSRYCADILRPFFNGPIQVIPHAVPALMHSALMPDTPQGPEDRAGKAPFRFYFCFDELSWYTRKNPSAVAEAFRLAFPDRTDVELLFKLRPAGRGGPSPLGMRSMSNHRARQRFLALVKGDPRIRVLKSDDGDDGMAGLMASCDCYVSLHRSEGFGYSMAEAMAHGKPVIASRFSGNLDYMDDDSAFLVGGQDRFMRHDEYIGVTPGASWFEPDVVQAAEAMRLVRDDPGERKRRAAAGLMRARSELSMETLGMRYRTRLQAIAETLA